MMVSTTATTRLMQFIARTGVDDDGQQVKKLLADGASPWRTCYTHPPGGQNSLHCAVIASKPKIVKTLLEHEPRLLMSVDDGGYSAAFFAAKKPIVMKYIVEKAGNNIDALQLCGEGIARASLNTGKCKETPLQRAQYHNQFHDNAEVITMLLGAGVDPNKRYRGP